MEKRLGRGLAQIIESSAQATPSIIHLRTEQIRPSRYQPRQTFEPEKLEELKRSVKRHGIIQPVIVRPVAHGIYELVAGERRWRAAKELGLAEVPAIIRALDEQQTMEHSLIENLQREDLNPLEEAQALARLLSEFNYTQEQVADAVGKERSTVANLLRLLKLPTEIQHALREEKISEGHAKALLGVEPATKQLELFRVIVEKHLSVRQLEEAAGQWQPKARRRRRVPDPQLRALEEELKRVLGTKASIAARQRGGRIVIDYFSDEDLTRILQALGVSA